jgi:hypothetical protein
MLVADEGIRTVFLRVVATRKVRYVLDCLYGKTASAMYVFEVTQALDEEVSAVIISASGMKHAVHVSGVKAFESILWW